MTGELTGKALPEVIVASMRTTVPGYDAFFEIVPKMGEYMQRVGAVCREPAYCFMDKGKRKKRRKKTSGKLSHLYSKTGEFLDVGCTFVTTCRSNGQRKALLRIVSCFAA